MFIIDSLRALLIICVLLTSTQLLAAEMPDSDLPRSIHVNGIGKVSAAPDQADLTLSVEIQAKTAEAARNQAALAMEALLKAVKSAGVAEKDIQTRSVSLYPVYSADAANKINGYQLTNQVSVIIRDINKISNVMDAAVKAGGNSTRVQGVSFSIQNPEILLAGAREQAYENARIKAQQYAKLAGATLDAPLHITESTTASPVPMPYGEMRAMKAAMADSAPTPVQAGEQEVSVKVDVVFGMR